MGHFCHRGDSNPPPPTLGARAISALAAPARAALVHGAHGLRVLGNFFIDTAGILRRPAQFIVDMLGFAVIRQSVLLVPKS